MRDGVTNMVGSRDPYGSKNSMRSEKEHPTNKWRHLWMLSVLKRTVNLPQRRRAPKPLVQGRNADLMIKESVKMNLNANFTIPDMSVENTVKRDPILLDKNAG